MAYLGQSPFGQTVRTVTSVVATAGQTTVYPTGGYTIGYVDVWVNGAKLTENSDFTANDGLSIVFSPALDADDQVETIAYGAFSLTDAIRRSGDTMSGTLNVVDVVPVNNTYSLGNTTNRFNDIYLSNSSIYLGDLILSSNATNILLSNSSGLIGTMATGGGVNTFSYTAANATVDLTTSNGSAYAVTLNTGNSSVAGLLKIVDGVTNTSTTTAATAYSVKLAYDTAVTAQNMAVNAYSNAASYADTKAAAAFTNAVAYAAANTYVNTQLALKADLAGASFTGAVAVSNTLAAGNTTITGFANISTALYVAQSNAVVNSSTVYTKSVTLDQAAGVAVTTGQMAWNSTDGTFDIGLLNGVTLQTGQELHFYGKATEAILNGQAVMFAGAQGNHVLFALANTAAPGFIPEWIIGIATQDFNANDFGYVTTYGKVRDINTSPYANGDILYVSSSVAGSLTTTAPTAPNPKIRIAAVLHASTTQGTLLVRPTWADTLAEAQDVYVSGTANNDILQWDNANSRWTNRHAPTFGNTTVSGFANISGTLTVGGTTTIGGNLVVNGTTITVNTAQINVTDSIMYLASNNEVSDSVDIGFAGHYNNGSGANGHTGFIRSALNKKYYLFQNYQPEFFANNNVDVSNTATGIQMADLVVGNLVANSTLTVTGNATIGTTLSTGNTTVLGFANVSGTLQVGSSALFNGALSGITTLAAGNTTVTGYANISGSIYGGALVLTGAASGITTLATGNTTVTGFVNVSTSVAAANINTSGTVSADIITVSNVTQTQTNLQVDPAGTAFLNALIYG